MKKIKLSTLPKTWLIDIDGVIFEHNSYLTKGKDVFISEFKKILKFINPQDYVILLTARELKYKKLTIESLKRHRIKYNKIIFNLPKGERILINDIKPKGLKTAVCINVKRNSPKGFLIEKDEKL